MDMPVILIRFGTYAVLSLIAGVPLFLLLSLGAARGGQAFARWRGPYALLLVLGIALALLGVLAATAMMAGTPIFPVDQEMLWIVLSATATAKAIVLRAGLLLLMLALVLLPGGAQGLRFPLLILLAMAAAATLGWSGHAAANEGMTGAAHLTGDIVHILAAAIWIGGMACLLAALRQADVRDLLPMLTAFAWIGGIVVALLIATGLLNMGLTIGADNMPALLHSLYGKLLAAKILLFFAMLGMAANNRFRLTPAFEREKQAAIPALRRAVTVEIGFAFLILALVAALGMIDPLGQG